MPVPTIPIRPGFGLPEPDYHLDLDRDFNLILPAGDEFLFVMTPETLWFRGTAYGDHVLGSSAGELISGEGGNDIIDAGGGHDMVNGGTGDDVVHGREGNDWISGGSGRDTIYGGRDNDRLHGEGDGDTIFGGSGNDLVVGGGGADWMDGGSGVDTLSYEGSSAGVMVSLSEGFEFALGGDAAGDQAFGFENLIGSSYRDELTGNDQANDIYGGAGRSGDNLYGRGGNDRLFGGVGEDRLFGGNGEDRLEGRGGFDWLFGDEHSDTLIPGAGGGLIDGGGGYDTAILEGRSTDWVRRALPERGEDLYEFTRAVAGGTETLTIYGVEVVQFSDATLML